MELTPDEPDIPGVVGRRSARLSIIVPVTVHGTDAGGQSFKENTWTISVNKHGGRIATFHRLAVDDQVVIENPLLGRTAKGRVNRVCEKRFAEDPYEVCVELVEAQNVWGVKLPAEDWERERQVVLGERKAQAAARAPETSAATVEEGGKVETPPLAPQGSPAEVGENAGGLSQFNMAVHALSRLAGEASVPPAPPTPPALPREEAPAARAQAPDLRAYEILQDKIDEAQSLRQELTFLMDRVQSTQREVENLVAKARETQREEALEGERAAKQIEEASGAKLQSMLSRLDQEFEQKFELASGRLATETEQRLQAQAASIVESTTRELGERLAPLAGESLAEAVREFQAQCKHAAEEARVELDELVKDTTAAIEARIQKVTEEIAPLLSGQVERSAEQVASKQLEEFMAQIQRARRSSEDSIQQNLEAMRQDIQSETLNAGIQARKVCKEESGTAAKAISVCVDSAVDVLNRAGDEATARLQGARQSLEVSLKKAEEVLPRLASEPTSMLEKFRAEAQTFAAQLQSEMESTARALSDKAGREISDKLEGNVEAALELVAKDLGKQTEDTLELLKAGLQSAHDQCVEETQKQLAAVRQSTLAALEGEAAEKSAAYREQLQAALVEMQAQQTKAMEAGIQASLEGLLESLRGKIQATEAECVEETQKQLAAVRQSTLVALEGEAAEKSAAYREQLQAALVEAQAQQTKAMEAEIQASLDGLLESLRAKIQSTADEAAARVALELRSSADQALQELPDQLYNSIGKAALVAKEWEEQAKADLEAHSRQLLEDFEKQLEALSAAARERQRSDAEALKGVLQSLNQAARLLEGLTTDVGQAKGAAHEQAAELPSRSTRPPIESPPLALEPLLEKQHQIIEEAMSSFRAKLKQILGGQTSKK